MWKRKKSILLLLVCCLSLALSHGTCSATEETYQMEPEELNRLEQIFSQLSSTTTQQSVSWIELNKQLQISKNSISDLQKQAIGYQQLTQNLNDSLSKTRSELSETKSSLQKANESLNKYEKEEQAKIRKLTMERDIALTVLAYELLFKK